MGEEKINDVWLMLSLKEAVERLKKAWNYANHEDSKRLLNMIEELEQMINKA